MAYTYLIGWTEFNKWYYGVKYKNGSKGKDLWVTYFTSSKHVKEFRAKYGEPDVVQVRHIFEDHQKACEWEHKVIKRLGAVKSDRWLNKSDTRVHDRTGTKHSSEVIAEMKRTRKGKNYRVVGMYKHSDEVKVKMREAHLKFKETDEGRRIHERTNKNLTNDCWKRKGILTCPYCLKSGTGPTMGRWHFNNCRRKL